MMKNVFDEIFKAGSVAIVGVSKDPYKAAHQVLNSLLKEGYKGAIYPISLKEDEVLGQKCYRSLADIKAPVDVVVIGVPAAAALPVVKAAADKGDIKGIVVMSAGFAETGVPELIELQKELVRIARAANMRVFGPNCIGITTPSTGFTTSFAPGVKMVDGNIGLITQSGALGGAVLLLMGDQPVPMGFSKWGHIGNMSDVTNLELLSYMGDDPEIGVVMLYLEGVKDGREFMDIASEVSKKKPVLTFKVGRTDIGSKATMSHTGTLAGSDTIYEAAMKQSGAIRVDSIDELVDSAKMISMAPAPRSGRVAIMTEAGGPGIISMDELADNSDVLQLAPMAKETAEKLEAILPSMAMVCKPRGYVDMTAAALAKEHKEALKVALRDPDVDSVMLISLPPSFLPATEVANAVIEAVKEFSEESGMPSRRDNKEGQEWREGKPLVACFMRGEHMIAARKMLEEAGIPTFDAPEKAIRAIANSTRAAEAMRKNRSTKGISYKKAACSAPKGAREIIVAALAEGGVLTEPKCYELLSYYGIQVPVSFLARSAAEAAGYTKKIGTPVVLKIVSPQIIHKSDVGGVKVNISSPEQAAEEYEKMLQRITQAVPSAKIEGVLVTAMLKGGTETIVGMTSDSTFGPVIMFGLGGIFVEVLKDVSFAVPPIDKEAALSLIKSIKSIALLEGARGSSKKDLGSIADVLVALGKLATENPEIAEIDMNPLLAFEKGAIAVDARILLKK